MRARAAAIVLLPMLVATAATQAQTPDRPRDAAARPDVPAIAQAAADARSHADADARECLEFVSNVGVIMCAERYRSHGGPEPRRKRSAS